MSMIIPHSTLDVIQSGTDPDLEIEEDGLTSLMYSSTQGHIGSVHLLLEAGASVDKMTTGNVTALHLAIYFQHPEIVQRLLVAGADPNIQTDQFTTAQLANYDVDTLELLIAFGLDVNAQNKHGETALFVESPPEVTKVLLLAGAYVFHKDNYGNTPLRIARDNNYANRDLMHIIVPQNRQYYAQMQAFEDRMINLKQDTLDKYSDIKRDAT